MATTDELLEMLESGETDTTRLLCEIDPTSRTIITPPNLILGVESDECSNRIYFTCPKIVGDNVDLTTLGLRIIYKNPNGRKRKYDIDDVTESLTNPDNIEFSWKLEREVTEFKGYVAFKLCAIKNSGTEIVTEWNTCNAIGKVMEGMELDENVDSTIYLIRGDSFKATLAILDTDEAPYIPDVDDSITFVMKQTVDDTEAILTKTIPVDTMMLTIEPSDTVNLTPGTYSYSIKMEKADGDSFTVIYDSEFILTEGVD